jgi:hypothetical protein
MDPSINSLERKFKRSPKKEVLPQIKRKSNNSEE